MTEIFVNIVAERGFVLKNVHFSCRITDKVYYQSYGGLVEFRRSVRSESIPYSFKPLAHILLWQLIRMGIKSAVDRWATVRNHRPLSQVYVPLLHDFSGHMLSDGWEALPDRVLINLPIQRSWEIVLNQTC
jgi:hypothetical protein